MEFEEADALFASTYGALLGDGGSRGPKKTLYEKVEDRFLFGNDDEVLLLLEAIRAAQGPESLSPVRMRLSDVLLFEGESTLQDVERRYLILFLYEIFRRKSFSDQFPWSSEAIPQDFHP